MVVCRLCLKSIEGAGISSPDIFESLDTFLPEMTLSLVQYPIICEKCLDNINLAYTFYQYKIDSDIKIHEKLDKIEVPKIDLKMLQGNTITTESRDICRICLKPTDNGMPLYKTPDNEMQYDMIGNMFEACSIPLNLEVSDNPMMCSDCWELLQTIFNFKSEFIDAEIRIKKYCKVVNGNKPLRAADLEKVVAFGRNTVS